MPSRYEHHGEAERFAAGCAVIAAPTSFADTCVCCPAVQGSYDKLIAEVPKYKMITPSVLADRLRVSLAL
jgi:S25 ribosomal protein